MRRRKTRALCAGLCSAAALAVLPTLASGATFEATPDLIAAPANNVGVHSMLYQDTPYSAKKEMFAQAKAAGASYIRLDLGLTSIFTRGEYRGHPFYQKNWAQTDQYAELANLYGVAVCPQVVYLRAGGVVDGVSVGEIDGAELNSRLRALEGSG